MTSNKKQDDNDSITVEAPELENIFNYDKERACWAGQYADHPENKIKFERPIPIEQTRWENFVAKVKDPTTGKYYRSGEGSGNCKATGEGPKREVLSLMRLKYHGSEFLLSNNRIVGFNQWGDPVITSASHPEKFYKTNFMWQTVPNTVTGYASRVNTGPAGSEVVYTLPFEKQAAQRLFDMRDRNLEIQFSVKLDEGKVYEVRKPNASLQENLEMFSTQNFEYLYAANYLSMEQNILNSRLAENEGLLPKMSDDERAASINAQKNLSQADKMQSYG